MKYQIGFSGRISVLVANILLPLITLLLLVQCTKKKQTNDVVLTLGAYTVPKEAYEKEILPAFRQHWQKKTGQLVSFQESYIGSGAQSRAIEGGFEADIAALSLQKDVDRLQEAGLIDHDWKAGQYNGMVTYSVVVIAVRKGNPKNIQDWDDLTKPGVQVICPSPKTSGGAMWNINAIYGAGLKLSKIQNGKADPQYARQLLKNIQRNIKVMDKSARASVVTFESGVGDVLLTYENEALLRQMQGMEMDFVIPSATIRIENPIAVVDAFVDKHKNRKVAEAFIHFVKTPASQRAFAKYGFRPVDPEISEEVAEKFPKPGMLFDVKFLGGWEHIHKDIYGEKGAWTKVMEELGNE